MHQIREEITFNSSTTRTEETRGQSSDSGGPCHQPMGATPGLAVAPRSPTSDTGIPETEEDDHRGRSLVTSIRGSEEPPRNQPLIEFANQNMSEDEIEKMIRNHIALQTVRKQYWKKSH